MYSVSFELSASLGERDAHWLYECLEPLADVCSFVRDNPAREDENYGNWRFSLMMEQVPDPQWLAGLITANLRTIFTGFHIAPGDFEIAAIPEANWLEESYRGFPAFTVGPFFLYGSHHQGPVPAAGAALQIDAATAFGTGEHGTTHGCLEALAYLKDEGIAPRRIADVGCGSGILAIAAWKLWGCPALATDIDAEAVRVTQRHAGLNGVPQGPGGLTCLQADGLPPDEAAFDLVIANILAPVLKRMAADLARATAPGGWLILSGLLRTQNDDVLESFLPLGFEKAKALPREEWMTLLLRKAART